METFAVCGKVNGGGGADDAPPESPGAVSLHAFFYVTKTIIIIIRQVIGLSLQKKCIKKKKSEPIPNWDDVRISWVWWSIGDSNS